MKVIKCTSDNRQAILDDATPVLKKELAAAKIAAAKTGPINIVNRHLTTRRPDFPVLLEKNIRLNCMFYVHAGPDYGDAVAETCYFISTQRLHEEYSLVKSLDSSWFVVTSKTIAPAPGSPTRM